MSSNQTVWVDLSVHFSLRDCYMFFCTALAKLANGESVLYLTDTAGAYFAFRAWGYIRSKCPWSKILELLLSRNMLLHRGAGFRHTSFPFNPVLKNQHNIAKLFLSLILSFNLSLFPFQLLQFRIIHIFHSKASFILWNLNVTFCYQTQVQL